MNYKYLCLVLIVCFTWCLMLSGCNSTKHNKIVIKHESKYSKITKKNNNKPSNVIDLSDGNNVNFDYNIGPQVPSMPSFKLVTIDK